ncbi:octaprenyl-diphosphate synthase [Rickettsia endosymbiont of Ixodes scapularis]|nr:octaprenyl-diphosphate synthase [Rickettsia endosymbiont of Ixodes scapularis]
MRATEGAWQSQDFGTRLLRQLLCNFLAMTEKPIHATMPVRNDNKDTS